MSDRVVRRNHRVRIQPLDYSTLYSILHDFEEQFGISTKEFLAEYRAGKFERNHTAARWAGYARLAEAFRPRVIDLVKPSDTPLIPA